VSGDDSTRAVPYLCPFCGEEDLRPLEQGRWHCRSCRRVFAVTFHGLLQATSTPPTTAPGGA
jgi:ribosomal protein L37AE/L43A